MPTIHAHDFRLGAFGFRDPEMGIGGGHVGEMDIVDVQSGIVFGNLPANETLVIEDRAGVAVSRVEAADADGYSGGFHGRGIS
jgi:hypothetical protein